MSFSGFPRDTLYTPVPDPLFGSLLEDIQDLAELKVTLRGMWLLHHKRQGIRVISLQDLLSDAVLLRGLSADENTAPPEEQIRQGLRQAVRRGTLLVHGSNPEETVFVLNDEAGRRTHARLREGGTIPDAETGASEPPSRPQERPNIFALYEDTIGTLTPIVAERLKEAEDRYPPGWIREAFEIAALENKRNWNYISAILARWGSEGKGEWRGGSNDDGKPGRDTPQNHRRKHIEDYQRRRGRSSSRTRTR